MPCRVTLVAALAENRALGFRGKMPWRLRGDLAYFRQLTWGGDLVMGRKTFESIGKPLPGRRSWIITRNHSYAPAGCFTCASWEEVRERLREVPEIFVVGGGEIYALALPFANRLCLTEIEGEYEGDAFFPDFDREAYAVSVKGRVTENGITYRYREYRRL